MITGNLARQLEADDVGFSPNRHHPEPTVAAPNNFYDDPPDTAGESATQAFAAWLKCCTHKGETLRPKNEIAVRIVGLIYLLDRGEKPIAQLAFEADVPRSTLHRCIRLISERTGLKVPHQKKTATATTATVSEKSV